MIDIGWLQVRFDFFDSSSFMCKSFYSLTDSVHSFLDHTLGRSEVAAMNSRNSNTLSSIMSNIRSSDS